MADPAMTTEAFSALLSRDFKRSLELLGTIAKQIPSGSKSRVDHNAAVVNLYAAGGPGSPDAEPHIRDLVHAAAGALPEGERPKSVDHFFAETVKNRALLNTVYSSCGGVHLYNLGVIAYNSDRIESAAAIGEVLYANVEAMEDWLALRSCFLMIDIHLRSGSLPSAANAGAFAERLIPGFSSNGSADENATSTLFPVAPNWKGKTASVMEPPISFKDASFCMHLYNARIGAAYEASNKVRKDAKNAVVAAEDGEGRPTSAALLVKARLESNVQKGLRTLKSIRQQTSDETFKQVYPIMLNTLGVLHHRLGLHAAAACYFEKSRTEFIEAAKSDAGNGKGWEGGNKDDDTVLKVKQSPEDTHVAYNLALQYMMMGVYKEALAMFATCARSDEILATTSPMLWIRMAECCVAECNKNLGSSQGVRLDGRGKGRRLVLWSEPYGEKKLFSHATICARTAISILDKAKMVRSKASESESGAASSGGASSSKDKDKNNSAQEDAKLRSVALAILAHASLEVDAKTALDSCNELVDVSSSIDPERAVLGRLYGAEALCMLGRPDDAVERLAPLLAMRTMAHAAIRDGAFVNVAMAHTMRGDMATAARAAKAALKVTGGQEKKETPRREALLVAAYVFLREGDMLNARSTLHSLRMLHPAKGDIGS